MLITGPYTLHIFDLGNSFDHSLERIVVLTKKRCLQAVLSAPCLAQAEVYPAVSAELCALFESHHCLDICPAER